MNAGYATSEAYGQGHEYDRAFLRSLRDCSATQLRTLLVTLNRVCAQEWKLVAAERALERAGGSDVRC